MAALRSTEGAELATLVVHKLPPGSVILGDSLLVMMTSLAEKEGLNGQVQMICVDPPYGIRFGSNWEVSTSRRDVKDGRAEDVIRQPEQVRAFRDTWQPGVDYCMAYLRDRLVTARDVLTETGSSFLQIGDEHVHLVQRVLDEVAHGEPAVPDGNAVAADVVDEVPGTPVGDAAALPTRQSRLVAAESGTAGGLVEGLVGPRGGTGIGEGAGGE